MTRTEEDLRSALESLERHAPDAQAMLADIRIKVAARRVLVRRRWRRSLLAGVPLATAAAVIAAMSAPWPVTSGPARPVAALTYGPSSGAQDAAALLRQLATTAATQPTPALGPYVYTKTANWGIQLGGRHYGLNYRSRTFDIYQEWVGPAGSYFVVSDPYGNLPAGLVRSGGGRVNPKNNPGWAWNNPATLPASPRLLRQHLLSYPHVGMLAPYVLPLAAKGAMAHVIVPSSTSSERPTPAQTVFGNALALMRTEPLRPAVRATLLRLMSRAVREIPGSSQRFLDLGVVTDRAGHRGIAVGQASNEVLTPDKDFDQYRIVHATTFWLTIYIFDPRTGALSGEEDATCTHLVTSAQAANKACYPTGYSQYFQIKAADSLPSAGRAGQGR